MIESLIIAIAIVESGNNPDALGDYEYGVPKAFGLLQIHEGVIIDVNEWLERKGHGSVYSHRDAFDPVRAKLIFKYYMERYANEDRLGREPTAEDMARIWNGGPYGFKKPSTEIYWSKVKAVLEKIQ